MGYCQEETREQEEVHSILQPLRALGRESINSGAVLCAGFEVRK